MKRSPIRTLGVGIVTVLVLGTGAASSQEQQGAKKLDDERLRVRERVSVKVRNVERTCKEGDEDCERRNIHRRLVFLGEDGELVEREIEGGEMWFSPEHRAHIAAFGAGGFLGVGLVELTPALRAHFGLPDRDHGILVSEVEAGSPAEIAGVEVGDVISAVDGEPVGRSRSLARRIRDREPGETVSLEVWRDGQVMTLTAALSERESLPLPRLALACGEDGDCELGDHDVLFVGDGEHAIRFGHEHFALHGEHLDCGDGVEECRIEIRCDEGDCVCTRNGVDADCDELSRR